VITVNAQGEMIVAGNTVTLPELEDLLRAGRQKQGGEEFEVRIRPDKRVPYKHIEPIMIACVRQGITEFGFQVLPK
jgi:biopolymer transport protein ExbD